MCDYTRALLVYIIPSSCQWVWRPAGSELFSVGSRSHKLWRPWAAGSVARICTRHSALFNIEVHNLISLYLQAPVLSYLIENADWTCPGITKMNTHNNNYAFTHKAPLLEFLMCRRCFATLMDTCRRNIGTNTN